MKANYLTPEMHLRHLQPAADIIITSIGLGDGEADNSDGLARERSGVAWDDYEQ